MTSGPHHPGPGNDAAAWMNIDFNPNFYSYAAKTVELLPAPVKTAILLFKIVLEYFLALYTLPVEVLLRWRWGTRALSLFQLCYLLWLPLGAAFWTGNRCVVVFLLITAGCAGWHFGEARWWETRHVTQIRLPYSRGEPLVFAALARLLRRLRLFSSWLFTEEKVTRFLEPGAGILVGLGLFLHPPTWQLGAFLMISSGGLFVKRHIMHLRIVDLNRDRSDAILIGKMLSEAAEQEREQPLSGPRFLVQLAPGLVNPKPSAPVSLPDFPQPPNVLPDTKPVAEPVPTAPETAPTSPGLPSWILEARVVTGPDSAGRLKVACPGCGAKIRCQTGHRAGLECPRCKAGFVFALPGGSSA